MKELKALEVLMPEEHKEDIKSVEGKIRELMKSKMKLNNGEKKVDEKT